MRIAPVQLALNHATNANFNTGAQQVQMCFSYAVQAIFTGTPTGTIKLQASNDPVQVQQIGTPSSTITPINWTDIASSTFTVTAAGTTFWNVASVGYNWFRVVYTDTSSGASTATVTINANIKGF